ncbi:MAG TPA: hypothetical protein QGH10_21445 [Armatimonadota bacterium]|nr:hypothetical protein [Armatimonadota bacterium]
MADAVDTLPESPRVSPRRRKLAVGMAGVGSSAAQVLIIRELMVASSGNELSIAVVLSLWLFWSGVGSWIGGWAIARSERPSEFHVRWIALIEVIVLGGCLIIARAGLYALREAFGGVLADWHLVPHAGGTLSLPQLLLLTTLATAPAGILLGWQFAAGAKLIGSDSSDDDGPSLAYIFDSLGHLVGGALVAIPAIIMMPAGVVMVIACLLVLSSVALLSHGTGRLALVLVAMLILGAGAMFIRPATLNARWHPHALRASYESRYGNISVLQGEGGERSFFINGSHAFETAEALAGEQWVDLPLLAHPDPKRVLLIGGGPRALRQVLRHDPERVVYSELDPTTIAAIRDHAPRDLAAALDDPRVDVKLGDARYHQSDMEAAGDPFDVILIALGDPTTAQLNRYYTVEWLVSAQSLATGGIVAFQAMSSGDYLNEELKAYNACLYQTAVEAGYAQVLVFPGPRATFLCSDLRDEITLFDDFAALEERINERGLDVSEVLASFYDALDPFRREDRQREMREATGVQINHDFAPRCYYYAQVLWASWWPGATSTLMRLAGKITTAGLVCGIAGISILLLIPTFLTRQPWRVAAPCAVFAAGACGMTLEVVILLAIQSVYGYVYGVIGLVIGVLMAGLAAGAWAAHRRRARQAPGRWLIFSLVAVAVVAWAMSRRFGMGGDTLGDDFFRVTFVFVRCFILGAIGIMVGAIFPCAVALRSRDGQGARHGTMLYGVDLIGACGGALLAGLILIPLLGAAGTCLTVTALAGGAAAIALVAQLKG